MDLIEVRSAEKGKLPIAKNTAYKWHSLKKHPRLLFKVSGKLFFDRHEWEKMAIEARKNHVTESLRAYRSFDQAQGR